MADAFSVMLQQLLVPDNTIRGAAEAQFNELKKQPDACVQALLMNLNSQADVPVRSLVAVLLRRLSSKKNWDNLSEPIQTGTKTTLLKAMQEEKTTLVRHKIADIVSEIAAHNVVAGQWNELVPFLFEGAMAADVGLRESCLAIIGELVEHLCEHAVPHLQTIHAILVSAFEVPHRGVRVNAIKVITGVVPLLADLPQQRGAFQQLVPAMLQVVQQALGEGEEQAARKALEEFIDMVEMEPSFMRPHIETIMTAMFQIATTESLDEETRNLGLEFFITLAEAKPGLAKKIPHLVDTLIPTCMNLLTTVEDRENWFTDIAGTEDPSEDATAWTGQEAMDRLAMALGGKVVAPAVFQHVPAWLADPSWQKRHAALITISEVCEGCAKVFREQINQGQIVAIVLPTVGDADPRVRWASCTALAYILSDLGAMVHKDHAGSILKALTAMLNDQTPRVQARAAMCIVNFGQHGSPASFAGQLDPVLSALMSLLGSPCMAVQESVVPAVATVAHVVKDEFRRFYSAFIPGFKALLRSSTGQEHRNLRGKAMECVSCIADAVGPEVFSADAAEVLELLLASEVALDSEDPQVKPLLQACCRICKCMGPSFLPYLPRIIPPVLAAAKQDPKIIFTDADDDEGEGGMLVTLRGLGQKRVQLRTGQLEEKAMACHMLFEYAETLGPAFMPYVEETAKIIQPSITFKLLQDVRLACVQTVPVLLKCVVQASQSGQCDRALAGQLLNFMFPQLCQVLIVESEKEDLCVELESTADAIDCVGDNCLNDEQLAKLCGVLSHLLSTHATDEKKRASEREADEDADEDEEDDDYEAESIKETVELLGALWKTHKERMVPIAQQELFAAFGDMLNPARSPEDQNQALCFFDDLLRHGGTSADAFIPQLLPAFVQYLNTEHDDTRRSAAYGIGLAAMRSDPTLKASVQDVVQRLHAAVARRATRESEDDAEESNAISAVAKIALHYGDAVDATAILTTWVTWLPFTEDDEEAQWCATTLATLLTQRHPAAMASMQATVAALGGFVAGSCMNDASNQAVAAALKSASAEVAPLLPSLPEATRTKVMQACSS